MIKGYVFGYGENMKRIIYAKDIVQATELLTEILGHQIFCFIREVPFEFDREEDNDQSRNS